MEAASIKQLVGTQSHTDATAVALYGQDVECLTYGELEQQIDYVGRSLRGQGIRRNDRVAVVLPNGPDMAAAFLGTAAYATCAPLNPQFRGEEFDFYLTDLQAKAIVLPAIPHAAPDRGVEPSSPAREVAVGLGLTVIDLVTTEQAGRFRLAGGEDNPGKPADGGQPDDVALVLHTSGTTSRPKLVPLSHQNLCASAKNILNTLQLTSADRCVNVMPLFHIHGLVGVLLSSLATGASVICSRGFNAETIFQLTREFEPTWYSAVPTIHQAVLAQARRETPSGMNRLRLIRSSSSALPPSVMSELETTFDVPVIESYGMTEAAHQMASNPLPPATRKPGAVGLPSGPDMAIMDDAGNLLPSGETGEIVIRGENVTAGYVNNPEANAAAFTAGWFGTGDLGHFDQDGYLFLRGRKKEMINRGGENISPREIDEALLEHNQVAQAVAFALPHRSLGEDVAAAVVVSDGASVTEQELREYAFSRLADFKVPSQIIIVSAIPKGPTGKLQRIGLHEKLGSLLRPEFVAPRTELEEALSELWQEVLEVDRVGVRDNFFALGGDSLGAGRLVSRINSRFNIDVAVTIVFCSPSIADQAEVVESALIDQLEQE